MRMLGVVTYYDPNKGYAFVRPLMEEADEEPVVTEGDLEGKRPPRKPMGEFFFHRSQLAGPHYRGIFIGAKVEFEPGERGLTGWVSLCE